jgi:hypothetical protein
MLAGNLASIGVGGIIAYVTSIIVSDVVFGFCIILTHQSITFSGLMTTTLNPREPLMLPSLTLLGADLGKTSMRRRTHHHLLMCSLSMKTVLTMTSILWVCRRPTSLQLALPSFWSVPAVSPTISELNFFDLRPLFTLSLYHSPYFLPRPFMGSKGSLLGSLSAFCGPSAVLSPS